MSLIISIIVILILAGLLIWAVGYLTMIPPPLPNLLIVLIIIVAVLLIAQKAGVL